MKKYTASLIAAALILSLTACGGQAAVEKPAPDTDPAPTVENQPAETAAPEPQSVDVPADVTAENPTSGGHHEDEHHEDEHSHHLSESGNVVEHDNPGYCGNTITTISCKGHDSEPWERSFWGSESVEITDLLRYLDYSGDVCRCSPEYSVKTEFSESCYGVNLTEGYARFEDGQCDLTEEQVEQIQKIIDWAYTQPEGGLSVNLQGLQPEE